MSALCLSSLADAAGAAASCVSDCSEELLGGRHEGRSLKRHQRRSVRSRSRHEKITKAKLNVLNVGSSSSFHMFW